MMQRQQAMWRLYWDTGEVVTELEAPGTASIELVGFPHTTAYYCRHLEGYFGEAMRLAGARQTTIDLEVCDPDAGRARWMVHWRE